MFYEHRTALSQCDYLFFFNGDVVFKRTILSKELIPCESEGYLLALSWHIYQIKSPKSFHMIEIQIPWLIFLMMKECITFKED